MKRKADLDMLLTQAPLVVDKDFIALNALHAIHSKPHVLQEDATGATKNPGYGRVPYYLLQAKSRMQEKEDKRAEELLLKAKQVAFNCG